MKEKYKETLAKTYELEGLVLLALSRNEIPEELETRIRQKLKEVEESLKEKKSENKTVAPEPTCNEQNSFQSERKKAHESKFNGRKPVIPLETVEAVKKEFTHFYSIEDDETSEEEAASQSSKKSGKRRLPPERKDRSEKIETTGKMRPEAGRKRPVFSLNDRFLFTRELFDGDPAAFNAAIESFETFDSFAAAEAHFVRELNLDPEKRDTDKAFVKMIKSYFE